MIQEKVVWTDKGPLPAYGAIVCLLEIGNLDMKSFEVENFAAKLF
jgi:hypothetical protein